MQRRIAIFPVTTLSSYTCISYLLLSTVKNKQTKNRCSSSRWKKIYFEKQRRRGRARLNFRSHIILKIYSRYKRTIRGLYFEEQHETKSSNMRLQKTTLGKVIGEGVERARSGGGDTIMYLYHKPSIRVPIFLYFFQWLHIFVKKIIKKLFLFFFCSIFTPLASIILQS